MYCLQNLCVLIRDGHAVAGDADSCGLIAQQKNKVKNITKQAKKGKQVKKVNRWKDPRYKSKNNEWVLGYTGLPREQRRQKLKKWFNFQCKACEENFLTIARITNGLTQKHFDIIQDVDWISSIIYELLAPSFLIKRNLSRLQLLIYFLQWNILYMSKVSFALCFV